MCVCACCGFGSVCMLCIMFFGWNLVYVWCFFFFIWYRNRGGMCGSDGVGSDWIMALVLILFTIFGFCNKISNQSKSSKKEVKKRENFYQMCIFKEFFFKLFMYRLFLRLCVLCLCIYMILSKLILMIDQTKLNLIYLTFHIDRKCSTFSQ